MLKPAPMPDLFPSVHDGGSAPGHNYITAERDWEWLFTSEEHIADWDSVWHPNPQTPFEAARQYGGLLMHNPGSRFKPMDLAQFAKTTLQSYADQDNADLLASADWDKFIESASRYKRENDLWLGMYVGGETTIRPKANETAEQLANRLEDSLYPILYIQPQVDWIGFDATFGTAWNKGDPRFTVADGPQGGMALLIRRLQARGYTVAIEPAARVDACHLRCCSVILSDIFRNRRVPIGQAEWVIRGKDRKLAPLVHPLEMPGIPILADRLTWKKTNGEKLAAIGEAQAAGYAVAYPLQHFPEVA